MPSAFRACYRAQFLNATLPTGVVGDLDRAVWHGHSHHAVSRGLRSVFWDRAAGQVVLFALALATIPVLAPAVGTWMLWALAAAAIVVAAARFVSPAVVRMVWAEARSVPGAPGVLSPVVVLSALAVAGHMTVFLIAARTVGVTAPMLTLVPLGLALLLVSAVPLSIAGWGPREGGAALIFGAAGLGASTGLVVSVAYGVLAMLATLPGLLAMRRRVADAADGARGGAPWTNVPTPS